MSELAQQHGPEEKSAEITLEQADDLLSHECETRAMFKLTHARTDDVNFINIGRANEFTYVVRRQSHSPVAYLVVSVDAVNFAMEQEQRRFTKDNPELDAEVHTIYNEFSKGGEEQ